jgi:ATP-dependent Clp protease ATP-binding subunit ClpC
VDFRNVILIMTSNLGSQNLVSGTSLGFGKGEKPEAVEDRRKRMHADVMVEVERHFRPEFLNRVDKLVIFNPLGEEDLARIVSLQLREVLARIVEKGLRVELDEEATKFLIKKGYSQDFGARPLRRAIEVHHEDPLAEKLLRGEVPTGALVHVTVDTADPESLSFREVQSGPTAEAEEPVQAGAE